MSLRRKTVPIPAPEPKELTVLRVALIGCGAHAREDLLPTLKITEGIQVTAICDTCEAFLAQAAAVCPGATAFARNEMIFDRANCDAVVLACPPQAHYKLARKALEAGLHVFVEKPPTVSKSELIELADLATKKKLITMVGHNLRHSTASGVLRDAISKTDFGRPVSVDLRYFVSGPKGKRWRLQSVLRSFLLSHGIHCIDLLIFQIGPIARIVSARFGKHANGETLHVQFAFRSGAFGSLVAVTGAPKFTIDMAVVGDSNAFAHLRSLRKIVVQGPGDASSRWERVWTPRTLDGGYECAGYQGELASFFDAVRRGTSSSPSLADERHVYDVIEQIVALA